MEEFFVILINVTYCVKEQDWVGKVDGKYEFETYPTPEQIEAALIACRDKDYPTVERATIHYARVEKRYRLRRA